MSIPAKNVDHQNHPALKKVLFHEKTTRFMFDLLISLVIIIVDVPNSELSDRILVNCTWSSHSRNKVNFFYYTYWFFLDSRWVFRFDATFYSSNCPRIEWINVYHLIYVKDFSLVKLLLKAQKIPSILT